MTTKTAVTHGERVQRLKKILETHGKGSGHQGRYENQLAEDSFKDVSVFTTTFGLDWDLIERCAADPAHEFHNLVKDLLHLLLNKGNMAIKQKHLDAEHKIGRFKKVTTPAKAPWVADLETLQSLEALIDSNALRIPHGWPKMVNYFGEDTRKGKGTSNSSCLHRCLYQSNYYIIND